MKPRINMEKIAKALGAERRGKISSTGGYFGAMQLAADAMTHYRVPAREEMSMNLDYKDERSLNVEELTQRMNKIFSSFNPKKTVSPVAKKWATRRKKEQAKNKTASSRREMA